MVLFEKKCTHGIGIATRMHIAIIIHLEFQRWMTIKGMHTVADKKMHHVWKNGKIRNIMFYICVL